MAPYEAYGAKLKAYRKRLGLSVAEFAERLGVSKATQANYEAGRTVPDLAYADRCSPLGIPPEELLCSRAAKNIGPVADPRRAPPNHRAARAGSAQGWVDGAVVRGSVGPVAQRGGDGSD